MHGLLLSAFWSAPSGSSNLIIELLLALIVPSAIFFAIKDAPPAIRRTIVWACVFFAGFFYVAYYLWPQPIHRLPNELPRNPSETISFWLSDALPTIGDVANVVAAFLLGLGVYSVIRIHSEKVLKGNKDAPYSFALLLSIFLMVVFGFIDYYYRHYSAFAPKMDFHQTWPVASYFRDLLFDGMLQQMDAAMFSLIAFFILSAAYRAFRIRSVEGTVLLATALIVVLGLMGLVSDRWSQVVGKNSSFTLEQIVSFLQASFQTASIRGITFGIGIGGLAMALRLWLGIEKQGNN